MAVNILVQKAGQAVHICKVDIELGNGFNGNKTEGISKCAACLIFVPAVCDGHHGGFPADHITDKVRGRFQTVLRLSLCNGLTALEYRVT